MLQAASNPGIAGLLVLLFLLQDLSSSRACKLGCSAHFLQGVAFKIIDDVSHLTAQPNWDTRLKTRGMDGYKIWDRA